MIKDPQAPPPGLNRAGAQHAHRDDTRAVAFLDIVGFSALMGADERATFLRWETLRDQLILPLIDSHGGVYVKSTGDGLLATFPGGEQAVNWAKAVQRTARTQGEGLSLRIGMHYGAVILDASGDVYGDCVNIAARLEARALPGGILISSALYQELPEDSRRDTLPAGQLILKNIDRRVTAFHIETDARQFSRPLRKTKAAQLPSIAVLPFHYAEDAEKISAKAIVDHVISSLTGVQELSVISHSSVRALGPVEQLEPLRAGEILGVDFVVCGSVVRNGDRLRTDVELIDQASGEVINTEQAVFSLEALFDAQNTLTEQIVALTAPEVRRATLDNALRQPPENFSAYENLLQASELVSSLNRLSFEKAYEYLQRSIAADPRFAPPRAWMARWRTLRVGQGWSDDPELDIERAAQDAQAAIRLDRRNALALATFGHVQAYTKGDYDTAITYLDRAASTGPNNAQVRALRSATLSFLGEGAAAVAEAEKALRLSPFDEQLFQFYAFLALAQYVAGAPEDACRWARRSLAENPNYTTTLKILTISQAAAGDLDKARETAQALRRSEPGFAPSQYITGRAPFKDPALVHQLMEHFRLAGMSP